jgi:hypothetical protein
MERDRTRLWVVCGRLLTVGFVVGVFVGVLTGVALWIILLVLVPLATLGSWLLDPAKSWWGPGPVAVMTDPETKRRWRRSELKFYAFAFAAMIVIVAVVAAMTA